ncbi:MAG: hypothetical protein KAX26_14810, partial [Anaerolineae bacterium]|nr:hypothetical protein [Anaerolineae bacterium]
MSEQSVRPDMASLLQALHQQAGQSGGRVRFRDVGTVQRISDKVATLPDLPRVQSDVAPLLKLLHQQAG